MIPRSWQWWPGFRVNPVLAKQSLQAHYLRRQAITLRLQLRLLLRLDTQVLAHKRREQLP